MAKPRILDFDIENRPKVYMGDTYTLGQITAIAWCWAGQPKTMECTLLGPSPHGSPLDVMLLRFRIAYNKADMVTGHYIRMHDLPIINGSLVKLGLDPLEEKLTCDTKLDLIKKGPTFSASQENLCAMFGIKAPKVHMNAVLWDEANELTDEGLKLTRRRAIGDVVQHMQLRKELVKRGLLSAPKVWRP